MKTIEKIIDMCPLSLRQGFALALAAGVVVAASVADARIVRLEILSVQSPTFGGLSFGTVGTYEKIFARAYGEVDPSDRRNSLITDIDLAPRNSSGMVEYSADVHIMKPVDMSKGNQRIFYDVVNRGNKGHGAFNEVGGNNPTTAEDAGTGLLMRRGYTLVFLGGKMKASCLQGIVSPLPGCRSLEIRTAARLWSIRSSRSSSTMPTEPTPN